jgi:hypothetical protein
MNQNPPAQRPPTSRHIFIFLFREHIIHDSDREQIKFREGQPDLHTSEKEDGRCHRAVSFAMLFRLRLCLHVEPPQFNELRQNLVNGECVKVPAYETLRKNVPTTIYSRIIFTDTKTKLQALKKFL